MVEALMVTGLLAGTGERIDPFVRRPWPRSGGRSQPDRNAVAEGFVPVDDPPFLHRVLVAAGRSLGIFGQYEFPQVSTELPGGPAQPAVVDALVAI
jgi:hypothetical protein